MRWRPQPAPGLTTRALISCALLWVSASCGEPPTSGADLAEAPEADLGVAVGDGAPSDIAADATGPQLDATPCRDPSADGGAPLCPSGVCIAHVCPTVAPEREGCAVTAACVMDSCPESEVCVDLATGKFSTELDRSGSNETGCIPVDVCAPWRLAGGARCERDWECESGQCLGIDCALRPGAFAFGVLRLCASAQCHGPNDTFEPCAEDTVQRITPDGKDCYCVPEDACDQAMGW